MKRFSLLPKVINIHFEVTGETIRVRVPELDLQDEISNQVAYSETDHSLVAIGLSTAEVQQVAPERLQRKESPVEFISVFKETEFERVFAEQLLLYYTDQIYGKLRSSRLSYLFPGIFDEIRIHLNYSGYDHILHYMKDYFVQTIGQIPRLGELQINGRMIIVGN